MNNLEKITGQHGNSPYYIWLVVWEYGKIFDLVFQRMYQRITSEFLVGGLEHDFSDFPYINQREHRAISSKVRSCRSMISNQHLVGVLEHEFYDFPYVGNSNPDWRTHIFQRGWSTTNQIIMVLDPHHQYYCSLVVDDCFSLGGLFASFRMVFHVVLLGVKLHFFIWSLKSGYTGYFLAKKCGQGKNKMHWVWCIRDHVESKWRPLSGCSLLHGKFIAPDPSLGNSIPTHAPIVLKCIKYPLVDWIYLYIYDQEGTYLSIITTNETPTHDICIIIILYIYI